ncbi:MAG TPA: cytochrome c3 family protein [Longimicrobiales bacterium]|nr:cytochrome c3 family protein [Longimicrobiales bacterium]
MLQHGNRLLLPVLLLALSVAGCRDETVVFPDRDLIGGVGAAAGGYLGYANPATNLTVCGACHVGQQRRWQETAHAGAWLTLQQSGAAQQLCEACHTVTHLGNRVAEPGVGFQALAEDRFHDVQCEACHGPGLHHVRNPDAAGNIPHASINAGVGMNGTCAECHSGFHHPFVDEWQDSRHGRVLAAPANNPECRSCHEGKAALEQMGIRANYLERGSTQHIAITCAVCHDPHENAFDGQLRYSINVPSEQENLCMRCHQKRGQPDPTTFRGPHAPEGPLLLGDAGWWPPNMPLEPGERIATTHGSVANPRLCAGCHVNDYTAQDAVTGEPIITTGHSFQATPCTDAGGTPTGERDCDVAQRSFQTCTAAGCHASQATARNAQQLARQRLLSLAATLNAQLALVPAAEFDPNDGVYTTAEGARFNAQLAVFRGTEVHNPFLAEALLIASIQQVQRDYGVGPGSTTSLDYTLGAAH